MNIEMPALAIRASFIATIATALLALAVVTSPAEAASRPSTSVLAQGVGMGAQPSVRVHQLQRALKRRGYDLGAPGVDGRFGPLTAAAVRRLQTARGLIVDGVVGRHTRAALGLSQRPASSRQRAESKQPSSQAQPTPQSTPAPSTTPAPTPSATPTASAPNTVVIHDRDSSNDLTRALFWFVLAAVATLAISALWRSLKRSGRDPATLAPEPRLGGPGPEARPIEAPAAAPAPEVRTPAVAAAEAPPPPRRVIGYMTTASEAWSDEHERSLAEIEAVCQASSWNLLEIVWDRANGKTLDRPGLSHALQEIAAGEARGLVVRDLQRLSRSPYDLGALMAWFREADATLVALDLGLDTSTPEGRQVASTLITLGKADAPRPVVEPEPEPIRAEPRVNGRPAVKDRPELLERITAMRAANLSLQEIADQLNAESIPTLRGGRQWRPSSIQAALGYKRPGSRERLPPLESRGGEVGG